MLDVSRDMNLIRRFLHPPETNQRAFREMNAALNGPSRWRSIGGDFAFVTSGNFGTIMFSPDQFELASRDSVVAEIVAIDRPAWSRTKEEELEYWSDVGVIWSTFVDALGLERIEIGNSLDDKRDLTLCAIVRYIVGQINGV